MSLIRKNYLFLTIFSLGFVALKAPIPTLTEFLVNNGLLKPLSAEQKTRIDTFDELKVDKFKFNFFGDPFLCHVKNDFMVTEKGPSQKDIDALITNYETSHPKPTQADIDAFGLQYQKDHQNVDWIAWYKLQKPLTMAVPVTKKIIEKFARQRLNSDYRDRCVQELKALLADSVRPKLDKTLCLDELKHGLKHCTENFLYGLSRLDREVAKKILTGHQIDYSELVKKSEQDSRFNNWDFIQNLYYKFAHIKIAEKLLALPDEQLERFFDSMVGCELNDEYLHFSVVGQDEVFPIKRNIALYQLRPFNLQKLIDESPELQTVNPSEFREFLFRGLEKEMNVWIKDKLVTPPAHGFSSAGFRGNSQAHVVDLCSAVLKEKYRERAKFTAAITFLLGMAGFASSFLIKKLERKNPNTKKVKHRKLLINGLWFGGLAIVGGAGIFYYLYLNHHREFLKIWSSFKQGVPFSRLWPYVLYV